MPITDEQAAEIEAQQVELLLRLLSTPVEERLHDDACQGGEGADRGDGERPGR